MSIVDAQQLRKTFGPRTILDGVDLVLQPGDRVGLVGGNGCGKSTLGRILAGEEPAEAGKLSYRRGARVAYLPQVPQLDPDHTALQAAMTGLGAWRQARQRHEEACQALAHGTGDTERWIEAQARAASDLERLGGWEASHAAEALLMNVGLHRFEARIAELSGGEQRRVALARALVARADLLILDEPTNHLDLESIEWLEGYLSSERYGALLLITHDRYLLDRVVERTVELEDGKLHGYAGGYATYLEGKAERLAQLARVEANRQNFLRRELEWLRRGPKARTTKQKARVDRAQAALDIRAPQRQRALQLELQSTRSGKSVLSVEALRLRLGDRRLIDGLDLHLTPGTRLGILGPNGSGKTSLLRCILGELPSESGRVILGKNVQASYLSQSRSGLRDEASIAHNVAGATGQVMVAGQALDARIYLERFLFSPEQQRQPVGTLSGGERTRVALAKLLAAPANLLLLDEPTNDLDIATRGALEDMLLAQNATALIVSHDRWFLDRVATHILWSEGDGRWTPYVGDYTTVRQLRKHAEPASTAALPRSVPSPRETSPAPRKRAALTYGERLELEGLEAQIETADARVGELEAQLADPDLYQQRSHDVPALVRALETARAESQRLLERWEELETKREAADQGERTSPSGG